MENKKMEKNYKFNANMAKENVKGYNEEMQRVKEEQAQKTVNSFLATIQRDSENGYTKVTLQSSHTDTVNSIVKKDLEELGFTVENQGQIFRISWS